MVRRRKMTRPVAWAVTLALSVVVSANCLMSDDVTPEEKACCASMGHDCGRTAVERACCPPEAAKIKGVAAATVRMLVAAPMPVLIGILSPPPVETLAVNGRVSDTRLSFRPPGIPTYLLVSTFRI